MAELSEPWEIVKTESTQYGVAYKPPPDRSDRNRTHRGAGDRRTGWRIHNGAVPKDLQQTLTPLKMITSRERHDIYEILKTTSAEAESCDPDPLHCQWIAWHCSPGTGDEGCRLQGSMDLLSFSRNGPDHLRFIAGPTENYREWWGYAAQITLPLMFVLDVVTLPAQVILFLIVGPGYRVVP